VKRYVAAVEGWKRDRATLVHHLAPGPDGTMRVARDGKKAITKVRVIERHRERALLELVLETGRTHQARVQLAREGAPIAGDVLYKGPRAPRLMLHASGLDIAHPNGTRLSLESETPPEMIDWVHHREAIPLERLVDWARTKRYALAHDPSTNAFRVIHEDGDGLPGVAVDLYDRWLVVQIHEGAGVDRESLLDALAMLDADGIYLKTRPRGPVPFDVGAGGPPERRRRSSCARRTWRSAFVWATDSRRACISTNAATAHACARRARTNASSICFPTRARSRSPPPSEARVAP
jgi:hypothetical protein